MPKVMEATNFDGLMICFLYHWQVDILAELLEPHDCESLGLTFDELADLKTRLLWRHNADKVFSESGRNRNKGRGKTK